MSDVPCNGCRRCCHGEGIQIAEHEDHTQWQTEPYPYIQGRLMLAHKPNMDCVYLGDKGCTIHGKQPQQCKDFDCRNFAKQFTYTQVRKSKGFLPLRIWQRGHELGS